MTNRWTSRAMVLVVLLTLAGSVVLTFYTATRMGIYRETMGRRAKDLDALAAIRADLSMVEAAHARFDRSDAQPPALPALVTAALPGTQAPELRDLSQPGPPGWILESHELSFDQVPAADAIRLALAAEKPVQDAAGNKRPGWRLAKCIIRSAPGQPGIGRVVLVMDTLVRESEQ